MPNLHLLTQTFSQPRHASGTGQINGLESPLTLLSGSEDHLAHLKEARIFFEVGIVRIAAETATERDIDALSEALENNRANLGRKETFLQTDLAFHRAIAAVSGNPIYLAVSQAMLDWLSRFHSQMVWDSEPGADTRVFSEHEAIFRHIKARDADAAEQMVRQHLTRASMLYQLSN